ncbi:MAG: hypothetical protein H0W73_12410 [Bacteroidetes bacterium]|nr:hypothetical protein [Bacteroidota bacterium]
MACNKYSLDYNPLDKIDLTNKPAIYFLGGEAAPCDFESKYGEYFINDTGAIHKLKNKWVFRKTDEVMACGNSYIIYLVQNDSVINLFSSNAECGYAFMNDYLYEFDKSYYNYLDTTKIQKLTRQQSDSISKKFRKRK